MARPFIEFIQSQYLDWHPAPAALNRPGVEIKVLSTDSETGACTSLLRYPAGWRLDSAQVLSVDEEVFVLRGALALNDNPYTFHNYGYLPKGFERATVASDYETIVLTCFSGTPALASDGQGYDPTALIGPVDTFALPWDNAGMDPNINHLHASRKNLRMDPSGKGRTYLLGGMPQGFPPSGGEPLELHPHVEEMFMVSGDMVCSLGTMRAGSYFWRPPDIWHGLNCSATGFLLFARTPGTNMTVCEWSTDLHPVTLTPEYKPVLPDELKPFDRGPLADPIEY